MITLYVGVGEKGSQLGTDSKRGVSTRERVVGQQHGDVMDGRTNDVNWYSVA